MHVRRVRARYWLLAAIVSLAFQSCISTRHVPKGQYLLSNNVVKVKTSQSLNRIRKTIEQNYTLESKMAGMAKQQPNRKTLGILKLNLWVYDYFYTTKDSGWRHTLITSIGEPHVLVDSSTLTLSKQLMEGYLHSKGYLHAGVTAFYKTGRKKAKAVFEVNTGPLYVIESVDFPRDSTVQDRIVSDSKGKSLLKYGDPFDADIVEKEQLRILREFLNRGYFKFSKDDIFFLADTTLGDHRVSLRVKVEKDDTSETQKTFRIRNIYLYPNYNTVYDFTEVKYDTVISDNMYFLETTPFLDQRTLASSIFMLPGTLYSRNDYECTLNRISDLAVYKFASVRFDPVGDQQLDCSVFLQPAKKYQLGTEVLLGNVEENLASALKLSFQSKNLMHRANRLDLSLTGGVQIPVFPSVNTDSLFYNIAARVDYLMPRFAFPFIHPRISCYNNPTTKLSVLGSYYQQTNYYTILNYGINYALEWKEVEYPLKRYALPIIGINYVYPTTTALFDERLEDDPYLAQSFEKQFIMSLGGAYTFSNQQINKPVNFTYLYANLETAGNMLQLFTKYIVQVPSDSAGSRQVFGVNFANYIRGEVDVRRYLNLSSNRAIVLRLNTGIAIPYGNSQVVPYVKKFFVGGTSSMRAWRVRSLGPGIYYDTSSVAYYSSAGDIKLEANLEFRFKIFSMFKGALFTDIGNIWNLKVDTLKPESTFRFDRFYKEFGIDAGFGMRADFTYFVMRLDLATRVYDPSLISIDEDPWVIRDFCLYCDSDGDGNNEFGKAFLLQLAVGYPF
jgi:outer membrane protein assembly factor BamA